MRRKTTGSPTCLRPCLPEYCLRVLLAASPGRLSSSRRAFMTFRSACWLVVAAAIGRRGKAPFVWLSCA